MKYIASSPAPRPLVEAESSLLASLSPRPRLGSLRLARLLRACCAAAVRHSGRIALLRPPFRGAGVATGEAFQAWRETLQKNNVELQTRKSSFLGGKMKRKSSTPGPA